MKQPTPRPTSRRRFLKHAAAVAAGPMIVRSSVLGQNGTTPPSERITLGLIGPGKQGSAHLGALLLRSDVQILGICDVQEERRRAARELIEKRTGVAPTGSDSSKDKDKEKKETAKSLIADAEGSTANNPWAVTDASAISGSGPATSAKDRKSVV